MCENVVLGSEQWNRWRWGGGDLQEQVLILTFHAWLNPTSFCIFLLFLYPAAAGAAPQAPSSTGPQLPPCTFPTTRLLLRWQQRPLPSPCLWLLTRATPTASPLPCSPHLTHIIPICLRLQQLCLHHHHWRLAPCQFLDILLLGVPIQVKVKTFSHHPHVVWQSIVHLADRNKNYFSKLLHRVLYMRSRIRIISEQHFKYLICISGMLFW